MPDRTAANESRRVCPFSERAFLNGLESIQDEGKISRMRAYADIRRSAPPAAAPALALLVHSVFADALASNQA